MNNENWEDYAVKTVKEQRDREDLIASFFLCSAFVEHYSKTRLFAFLIERRPIELINVKVKRKKESRKAIIWSKMKRIISKMNQRQVVDVGLLVGAWNKEVYDQLMEFNTERNNLVHEYENLLQILEKDEKRVRRIIELGLALLHSIKRGYADHKRARGGGCAR